MINYDLELRHLNEVLRRSYGIRASDRVLDVGCGTGQTTREAARLATAGAVLGIDRSDAMIERARSLARAAGLANVEYECADVERHALARERFDVAISRFGTMFFDHPVAAFANIRSTLRPDGRLVMRCGSSTIVMSGPRPSNTRSCPARRGTPPPPPPGNPSPSATRTPCGALSIPPASPA